MVVHLMEVINQTGHRDPQEETLIIIPIFYQLLIKKRNKRGSICEDAVKRRKESKKIREYAQREDVKSIINISTKADYETQVHIFEREYDRSKGIRAEGDQGVSVHYKSLNAFNRKHNTNPISLLKAINLGGPLAGYTTVRGIPKN